MIIQPMQRTPKTTARIAGVVYVLVFVTSIYALLSRTRLGLVAGLVAGALYVVVTVLFYFIFKPVNPTLSLIAAIISIAGITVGPLGMFIKLVASISPLVFFGTYCALLAFLIFKSTSSSISRCLNGIRVPGLVYFLVALVCDVTHAVRFSTGHHW